MLFFSVPLSRMQQIINFFEGEAITDSIFHLKRKKKYNNENKKKIE
jgi:hypothetical protein